MVSLFERYENEDVSDLIAEYPLAWVQSVDGAHHHGSHLPLLSECDEQGAVVSLIGHMARSNPLAEALSTNADAIIMFHGPQSYISPSWVRKADWAPTWNYAQLTIHARISFDALSIDDALERLVIAQEAGRENAWNIKKMGSRYQALSAMVVPFRATVDSLEGKFKLGQDESAEIFSDILEHLPAPDMAMWMHRFNDRKTRRGKR